MNTAEGITGKGTYYLNIDGPGSPLVKAAVFFSEKGNHYLAFIEPPAVITDKQSLALRGTLAAVEERVAWLNDRSGRGLSSEVEGAAV